MLEQHIATEHQRVKKALEMVNMFCDHHEHDENETTDEDDPETDPEAAATAATTAAAAASANGLSAEELAAMKAKYDALKAGLYMMNEESKAEAEKQLAQMEAMMAQGMDHHARMERFEKTYEDIKEELHEQNHMLCAQAVQIYNALIMHSHTGEAKYHHFGMDGKFGTDSMYGSRSENAETMRVYKIIDTVMDLFAGAPTLTATATIASAVAIALF